jgi:hypothetical protein
MDYKLQKSSGRRTRVKVCNNIASTGQSVTPDSRTDLDLSSVWEILRKVFGRRGEKALMFDVLLSPPNTVQQHVSREGVKY